MFEIGFSSFYVLLLQFYCKSNWKTIATGKLLETIELTQMGGSCIRCKTFFFSFNELAET